MRLKRRCAAAGAAVGVALGGLCPTVSADEPVSDPGAFDQRTLGCAAGLGCEGLPVNQNEAAVLLGLDEAQARARYDAEYGTAEDDLTFDESEGEVIEQEAAEDLSFEESEGDVIEPPAEEGDGAGDAADALPLEGLEGYAEAPCAGRLYEKPTFMSMEGYQLALCNVMNTTDPRHCGLSVATFFCATKGRPGAVCFGVEKASRAINLNVACENCDAFSFIVCR